MVEVDDDWLLSGTHKVPAPNIRIVTASLPSDGDYSAYIIAGMEGKGRGRGRGEGRRGLRRVLPLLFYCLGNSKAVQTQKAKTG